VEPVYTQQPYTQLVVQMGHTFITAVYDSPSVECSLTLIGYDVPSPSGGVDEGSALTLLVYSVEIVS